MKPAHLNFKNKRTSRLFLLLCLLGVAALAWWAWAAGPIHPNSSVTAGQKEPAQSSLVNSGYSPVNPAPTSSNTVNNSTPAQSPSQSTSPSTSTAPVTAEPSNPICSQPGGGIQPDTALACNCGLLGAAYPCCQYQPGVQLACPDRL